MLKTARAEGVLDFLPAIEREKRKDNPRQFFQFAPLVSPQHDEYKLLLRTAKQMAAENVRVRESVITMELYDFIIFLMHSFVRPIVSEIYSLTHRNVAENTQPRRLSLTIKKGKTGQRRSETLEEAVFAYRRLCSLRKDIQPDDYVFLPSYANRSSAMRIMQRQFNALLERCNLKKDPATGLNHSLYSLRHTAICMRLVLSKGQVNIYSLAKNAGTSVNQIERFYAKRLPLTEDLIENLQSFGREKSA